LTASQSGSIVIITGSGYQVNLPMIVEDNMSFVFVLAYGGTVDIKNNAADVIQHLNGSFNSVIPFTIQSWQAVKFVSRYHDWIIEGVGTHSIKDHTEGAAPTLSNRFVTTLASNFIINTTDPIGATGFLSIGGWVAPASLNSPFTSFDATTGTLVLAESRDYRLQAKFSIRLFNTVANLIRFFFVVTGSGGGVEIGECYCSLITQSEYKEVSVITERTFTAGDSVQFYFYTTVAGASDFIPSTSVIWTAEAV